MTKDIKSQSGFFKLFLPFANYQYYVLLKSSIIMNPDDGRSKDIFDCNMSLFLIFISIRTLYSSYNYVHKDVVILYFFIISSI